MKSNVFELSDALSYMRAKFLDFQHTGVNMDSDATAAMVQYLNNLVVLSKALENEITRHRWNTLAREDRKQFAEMLAGVESRMEAETLRPGSNVVPFNRKANQPSGNAK